MWFRGVRRYVGTLRTADCNVALIRPLRVHLPPRGRLWVVPCIIRRYNTTSLYDVARAFPEGEGGPAQAGSNEGYVAVSTP